MSIYTLPKQEASNYDYFAGKKPERTYISKRLFNRRMDGTKKGLRIISKVIDSKEGLTHAVLGDEIVLRATLKGRQQIVAKVYEDNKGIFQLIIQRFSLVSGIPHETYFSFDLFELRRLKEFIDSIPLFDYSNDEKSRVEDDEIRKIREFLSKNPDLDLLIEFAQNKVTKEDIVALGYRKEQLGIFVKLLNDETFFNTIKKELSKIKDEDVWQTFFEKNPWIFGYGLNFVFNSPLEGKKMEQAVSGSDFNSSGKITDGLLKTAGLINSICLVEIKTPKTDLIKNTVQPYRAESWQVSDELNGGVAQSHKTVQKTIKNIGSKVEIKSKDGNPTGEVIYSYQPKSYLIAGKLSEFITAEGVNEDKLSSFELFRRNLVNPEIITFDELYERAKYIVHNAEEASQKK